MEPITIIFITVVTTAIILSWLKNKFNYWRDRGIETTPYEYFWGHGREIVLQKEVFGVVVRHMYEKLKPKGIRHFGMYLSYRPIYIPVDVEIVKSIMQNDFQHFTDRGVYINEKNDPLSAHLFSLEGKKWKLLRNKLTPTFTSGRMKMMFENLEDCSKRLQKVMDIGIGTPVDIKQVLNRFTMDVIGSCAFGIEINSLENPESQFLVMAKKLFYHSPFEKFKGIFRLVSPALMKFLGTTINSNDVTKFFMSIVKNTVEYRENNGVFRKDFMHLLIQLKNRGKLVDDEELISENLTPHENSITIEEIAAQAFIFFEAGFETSSSAMAFCLFELGQNEVIQNKARNEVRRVLDKYGGNITYDALAEMEYLGRCINETLRKYPILPLLNRVCTKEYRVPGTNLIIEKNMKLFIPIYALHYDPVYFPEPEVFDPDRFSEENKKFRPAFCYMPFGEGPRICIGMRFGLMQTKVGLATILRDYNFKVNEQSFPFEFDAMSVSLSSKRGIWLDYTKI